MDFLKAYFYKISKQHNAYQIRYYREFLHTKISNKFGGKYFFSVFSFFLWLVVRFLYKDTLRSINKRMAKDVLDWL